MKGQNDPHYNFSTDQKKRKSDLLEKHGEQQAKCLLLKDFVSGRMEAEREKQYLVLSLNILERRLWTEGFVQLSKI